MDLTIATTSALPRTSGPGRTPDDDLAAFAAKCASCSTSSVPVTGLASRPRGFRYRYELILVAASVARRWGGASARALARMGWAHRVAARVPVWCRVLTARRTQVATASASVAVATRKSPHLETIHWATEAQPKPAFSNWLEARHRLRYAQGMGNADEVQRPENLPALRAELRERSKELGYLHQATRLIHTRGEPHDILQAVLELLPSAMCYPELMCARLCLGPLEMRTGGYVQMEPSLRAAFRVDGEGEGFVEVRYTQPPPSAPAFLDEELSLLGSLAELLRGHFELMHAETAYRDLMHAAAEQQSALSEHRAQNPQLSHLARELRSSSHGILASIQILKQGSQDANLTAQGLQILEKNITHQAKLIEELLDLSGATTQAKGTRPLR